MISHNLHKLNYDLPSSSTIALRYGSYSNIGVHEEKCSNTPTKHPKSCGSWYNYHGSRLGTVNHSVEFVKSTTGEVS